MISFLKIGPSLDENETVINGGSSPEPVSNATQHGDRSQDRGVGRRGTAGAALLVPRSLDRT